MFDVAIVGTGPAGLSTALTLKLHNKDIIWFGSAELSDKVGKSEKIANYPGVPMVSGADLNRKFYEQARELGLEPVDKRVTNIADMGGSYMILADNEMFEARTVLLSTGIAAAKGMENESRLLGAGVSYCATCDGFLYKGKTIAVICASKRYEHEVQYLAELAEKVYLNATYKDVGTMPDNVEIISPIREINGSLKADMIRLNDGTELAVNGIFCLRNAVAPSTLLPGLQLDGPHIVVNRSQETNIPGCFAAGDCTGRPYQLTKAVGEGNVAAHAILDYINKN